MAAMAEAKEAEESSSNLKETRSLSNEEHNTEHRAALDVLEVRL